MAELRRIDGRLAIDMTYDESRDHVPRLRNLPGSIWDKDRKVRWVSDCPDTLPALVASLLDMGVIIPDDIVELAGQILEHQKGPYTRAEDPRLYPFQKDGVMFLRGRTRALLGDEMGTGKTIQALMALPTDARAIAVVPSSLKYNWKQECEAWRPDLKPIVIREKSELTAAPKADLVSFCKDMGIDSTGTKPTLVNRILNDVMNRWPAPGEFFITNYDILWGKIAGKGKDRQVVFPLPDPTDRIVVISDESQKLKNRDAQRTMKFRALKDKVLAAGGRVWLMTGTPLMNNPPELWNVLEAADLSEVVFGHYGRFYGCFGGFKKWIWNGYKNIATTVWGKPKEEVPTLMKWAMLRRVRLEVLPDLPVKTHRTMAVNGISKKLKAELDDLWEATGPDFFEEFERADQPEKLPKFEEMSQAKAALAEEKIPALLKLVEDYEENEEPLVVFSAHLAPIEALEKREGWAVIHGGVGPEARQAIVNRFQAGDLKGVALTIEAGNFGLTLTRASHMIFNDLQWTPASNVQAEDRICRIGQDRGCQYTILQADHVLDRHITDTIRRKMRMIDVAIRPTSEEREGESPAPQIDSGDELRAKADEVRNADPDEARRAEEDRLLALMEKGMAFLCPGCGRILEVRVSKSVKNPGKEYVSCRPCDYFAWAVDRRNPIPQEAREWTHRALRALAGMCDGAVSPDGVGFNGTDTKFGRSLAYKELGELTDGMVRAAFKMLMKYHRQLEGYGVWPPPKWRDE
jgi:SWI/SNF-related matrix-associated actin-dependent regulator 1 of chromatin subfamily A